MDQRYPAHSFQPYDDGPVPEHPRSSRTHDRHYRDRSPTNSFNRNDGRVYRCRSGSRHRDSRPYQSDSMPRYGREGQIDVTLPKNFPKPLTCFFWANNGRCSKRDQDCAYAHWNTGHLAGSPITVSAKEGVSSVAGKKARDYVSDTYRSSSSTEIESRKAALRVREGELDRREKKLAVAEALLEEMTRGKQEHKSEVMGRNSIVLETSKRANSRPTVWTCKKCGEKNVLDRNFFV